MSTQINVTVGSGGLPDKAKQQQQAARQAQLEKERQRRIEAEGAAQRTARLAAEGRNAQGQSLTGTPNGTPRPQDEPAATRIATEEFYLFKPRPPTGTLIDPLDQFGNLTSDIVFYDNEKANGFSGKSSAYGTLQLGISVGQVTNQPGIAHEYSATGGPNNSPYHKLLPQQKPFDQTISNVVTIGNSYNYNYLTGGNIVPLAAKSKIATTEDCTVEGFFGFFGPLATELELDSRCSLRAINKKYSTGQPNCGCDIQVGYGVSSGFYTANLRIVVYNPTWSIAYVDYNFNYQTNTGSTSTLTGPAQVPVPAGIVDYFYDATSNPAFPARWNAWDHWAAMKKGGKLYVYINGVCLLTLNVSPQWDYSHEILSGGQVIKVYPPIYAQAFSEIFAFNVGGTTTDTGIHGLRFKAKAVYAPGGFTPPLSL